MAKRPVSIDRFAAEYRRVLNGDITPIECYTYLGISETTYHRRKGEFEGRPDKGSLGKSSIPVPNLLDLKQQLNSYTDQTYPLIVQDTLREVHIALGKLRKEYPKASIDREHITDMLAYTSQLIHRETYTQDQLATLRDALGYRICKMSKREESRDERN